MKVTFAPAALRDIRTIGTYLTAESPYAARRFAEAVLRVRSNLADHPESGTLTARPPVRFVLLMPLQYKLFYRLVSASELRVMRVRHARRRPLY